MVLFSVAARQPRDDGIESGPSAPVRQTSIGFFGPVVRCEPSDDRT